MLRHIPIALLLLTSCSEKEEIRYAPPPVYQTLHPPKTHGALFQFQYEGNHFIACSIHQGYTKPKAQIFPHRQTDPVIIAKHVHKQKDLHVWTYDEATLSPDLALTYRANPKVGTGDRIYILNKGQQIAATVVAEPSAENFRYTYQTDEPFPAGGMSGSPVYFPSTGSVIGVLQTANDKQKATVGGFELLEMP